MNIYSPDYSILIRCDDPDIEEYSVYEETVVIAPDAFRNCTNLRSIDLGYVSDIGDRAFMGCQNLQKVSNYGYIENIGYRAFYDCSNLESISPDKIAKSIGHEAFAYCAKLKQLSLARCFAKIGHNPFIGCNISLKSKAKDFTVYKNLLINNFTCELIASLKDKEFQDIPDSVKYIGEYAFAERKCLKYLLLPDFINTIESHAFFKCSNLQWVSTIHFINRIAEFAFSECGFRRFNFPDNIPTIDNMAFANCPNLYTISCPTNIPIRNNIFQNCPIDTVFLKTPLTNRKKSINKADLIQHFSPLINEHPEILED